MKTTLNNIILCVFFLSTAGCTTVMNAVNTEQIETNPNARSAGAKLDDKNIRNIAQHNIKKAHPDLEKSHIKINSYNGVVLISGETASEEMRTLAFQTVEKIANVRLIHNELVVRGNSSFISRTNDSYLDKKIKLNLSKEEALDNIEIEVVVRDSVVFLMGLVSQEQGDIAAHTASLTSGVRRVVKVFEFID